MEKKRIVFLPLPESIKKDMLRNGSFELNPAILIPVEEGEGAELSWEMIIAGMLRVIADHEIAADFYPQVTPEWIDYYRAFVLGVKPEIYHEFTSASIVKTENNDFDMALEINAVLEGLFPGSPGVLLNKAIVLEKKTLFMEKNGQAAEEERARTAQAYEAVLSLEPVLPDALFNAGFFFMRLRDFSRAKDCFSRYVSLAEKTEIPKEFSQGIPGEKIKQAKEMLNAINSQGLDDGRYLDAYDCISRGDNETGLSLIKEFIEKNPKVHNGWFVLGWALRKTGRYKEALEAFKKAEELKNSSGQKSSSVDTRNEMAICLMELGDLKAAKKELEQALFEEPENIKIISNLGVLAKKAGNENEAAAFFRTILELDPDDPLARHFLGM